MAEFWDTNIPIAYRDPNTQVLKATPEFEDFLYQIVQEQGGESENLIEDAYDLAVAPPGFGSLHSKVLSLSKKVSDIEACVDRPSLEGVVKGIKRDIKDIQAQLTSPPDIKPLLKRIADLEAQVAIQVNTKGILKRLNDIEAQL